MTGWEVAVLGVKVVLVPGLVGLASWAGRLWGASVGGWAGALPLTSGPVVLILALEQGPEFGSGAARGALLGVVPLCAFAATYGRLLARRPWWFCVACGCAIYLAVAPVLAQLGLPLPAELALAVGTITLTLRTAPVPAPAAAAPAGPGRWEIPARMATAVGMVLLITGAAERLGPELAGVLTPFPVVASILAGAAHRNEGSEAVARLLRGLTLGCVTFAIFFFLLGALLVPLGLAGASALSALGAVVAHHRLLRSVTQPRPRLTDPPPALVDGCR